MEMWTNYKTESSTRAKLWDTYLNKYKYGFFFLDTFLAREIIVTRTYYRLNVVQSITARCT